MQKRIWSSLAVSGSAFALFTRLALASTTATLTPTSDGNYKQFLTSSGSTHYTLVDESICNGNTDYTYTTTTTKRDSYGINISTIGNGALISQVDIHPCASRQTTGTGTATGSVFYRYNGIDSSDGTGFALTGTTPTTTIATTTFASLNLFKTSTSTFEIGALYATGTKGMRLSQIATKLTYSFTAPSAPTLSAANNSSTQNNLTWTPNSSNQLGFRIYRAQNGGSYTQTATTTWSAVSYADTGLTADQTYQYKVVSYNDAGTATSNVATAITYNTVPLSPTSVTATSSGSDVVVTWTDNSHNEDNFLVERSSDGSTFFNVATTTLNFTSTTSWTDIGAASGSYYYRVKAKNAIGSSSYSNTAEYNISHGPTRVDVNADISADTTWDSNHVYVISGNVNVNSGVTLNILAGTVVKLDYMVAKLSVQGYLRAVGETSNKIYFTSYYDDTVPVGYGDTNGDSGATHPQTSNYWDTIQINANASSTISNAVFRYGGYLAAYHKAANIDVNGGILSIDNSEVATTTYYGILQDSGTSTIATVDFHNAQYGAYLNAGMMTVSGSSFHNFSQYGLYTVDHSDSNNLTLTGSSFTINTVGAARIGADSFTHWSNSATGTKSGFVMVGTNGSQTWTAGDNMPYIVDIADTVLEGPTLHIDPGAVVKFTSGSELWVLGTLEAPGSSTSGIIFTAITDDNADGRDTDGSPSSGSTGYWEKIHVDSGGTANISYATIKYGGSNNTDRSEVLVTGGSLDLEHSDISYPRTYGIRQNSGASNVISNQIHNNSYGMYAGSGSLELVGNTFSANTYDTSIDPSVTYSHWSNTFSSGNDGSGVGGTISSDTTWNVTSTPYVVTSTLTIAEGATLTINPGAIVKFSTTTSKIVVDGALNAAGSTTGTIYFTSIKDDTVGGDTNGDCSIYTATSGDWDTIQIDATASATLTRAVIRYGGYHPVGSDGMELFIDGGSLSASSVEVATGTTYGIYQDGGNSTTVNADIHHAETGYWLQSGKAVVRGGFVHDMSAQGVYNYGGDSLDIADAVIATTTNYGIMAGGNTNKLRHLTIYNQEYGVYVTTGQFMIRDSELFNEDYGIYLHNFYDACRIYNSHIHDVDIDAIHEQISDSGLTVAIDSSELDHSGNGILLASNSAATKVNSTNFHDNIVSGFHVDGSSTGNVNLWADQFRNDGSFGVSNSSTKQITADYNYWGAANGPSLSGGGGGSGDTVSAYVLYDPYLVAEHYLNADANGDPVNSVDNGEIRWDGSTQFTDAWYWAVDRWNELGRVTITTSTNILTRTLTINDDDSSDTAYVALYHEQLWPYPYAITMYSHYMGDPAYEGAPNKHAVMHELGHALGLAHSYDGNIMYYTVGPGTTRVELGDQDKSDYYYIWGGP